MINQWLTYGLFLGLAAALLFPAIPSIASVILFVSLAIMIGTIDSAHTHKA